LTTKSSLKRVKTSAKKRIRNMKMKSYIKKAIKDFDISIEKKDLELARKLLIKCNSLLDKARSKKLFHKGKVNRIKSKLSEKLNILS